MIALDGRLRLSDLKHQAVPVRVRARYDAAYPDPTNDRHWLNADSLAPNDVADPETRFHLRNRARYEVRNNSWAYGMVQTLANYCVGTGPRLQLQSGDNEQRRLQATRLEKAWEAWSLEVDLAEKLRQMRSARAESGEAFGVLHTNPSLRHAVKLDVRVVEADLVETPFEFAEDPLVVDGIRFDAIGNRTGYYLHTEHPGSARGANVLDQYELFPARHIIHYYKPPRPGAVRGVPDISPALPLFAQLRRYHRATLEAAETAANIAAVIYTDSPGAEVDNVAPLDQFDLERGMATTLPSAWKIGQVRSEHPATTHEMFMRGILNEIARCLEMPFNIAFGNSSGYNYASGRLDHQSWFKKNQIEQSQIGRLLLQVLAAWLAEASLLPGVVPPWMRRLTVYEIGAQWFWDGLEHVDPAKEANAQATRLSNHTTTLAYEYARQGRDWETALRQRAKEARLIDELGLVAAVARPSAPHPPDNGDGDDDDDEA